VAQALRDLAYTAIAPGQQAMVVFPLGSRKEKLRQYSRKVAHNAICGLENLHYVVVSVRVDAASSTIFSSPVSTFFSFAGKKTSSVIF
jgi:hypothetical protein